MAHSAADLLRHGLSFSRNAAFDSTVMSGTALAQTADGFGIVGPIFLAIMARLAGFEPGVVTIQATNAHIYGDHFDQVHELLAREHLDAPKLILSDNIKRIERLQDIAGAFERIEPADITLEGYESHAAIKAPMAA